MILNLTQHLGTPEQGVTEPKDKQAVIRLLTLDTLPDAAGIERRATALAAIAAEAFGGPGRPASPAFWPAAMIGGAPFLMGALERALHRVQVRPVYAFSIRESVDQPQPDGSVRKVAVFRHLGFVEVAV